MIDHDRARGTAPEARAHRHDQVPEETPDPGAPRLGRRESEPHSEMINYMHDVLSTSYPNDRVTWDLHHYFVYEGESMDLCYDISLFSGFSLPVMLSSYKAADHDNRVPDMAINVLSKSTHANDIGKIADLSMALGIKVYVVFASHDIGTRLYRPPFLRAYMQTKDRAFTIHETRHVAVREQAPGTIDEHAWLDPGDSFKFKLGIMETSLVHAPGFQNVYRPVFMDKASGTILLTAAHREKQRADQEKQRADQEKQRADQEKQRADQEKQRADQEKQRADTFEEELRRLRALPRD